MGLVRDDPAVHSPGAELLEVLPAFLQARVPAVERERERGVVNTRSGLARTRPVLSALETLVVPLDFQRTSEGGSASPSPSPPSSQYAGELGAALRARKRAGVPVKELVVPVCARRDRSHFGLGKVVGRVRCAQCGG